MEQQNQVQTLEDTQELRWHEESTHYVYNNGTYSSKDLDGNFMTLASLRDAWKSSIQKRKRDWCKRKYQSIRKGLGVFYTTPEQRCEIREQVWAVKDKWQLWQI